jgi:hypothetical protein
MATTSSSVANRNVTVVDYVSSYTLQCNECGKRWSPNIQPGGRLPRYFAMCENRCNADTYGIDEVAEELK